MSRTDADRLRDAVLEIRKLRAQLAALSAESAPPVAIVGAACRIHGGADNPDAFWQILRSKTDCITETPATRWDLDAWYSTDPDAPGKLNSRRGGYLHDLSLFDPTFFGISEREAQAMDPQQRLLLELSWEAFESAAHPLSSLSNEPVGVFFALNNNEYFQMAMEGDPVELNPYSISGGVHSTAAGRVSYLFDLRGPSLSVDTACSSSLSATHLAIQSLRSGECRMALAGGVHLTLRPNLTVGLSRLRMIAPDGACKAFDEAADGFVQGEGAVVVALKLLADAIRHRDPILGVIRGTAINQDGRTSGLTAPNGTAQEEVIRAALEQSGLPAEGIGFVETHGTGTALGDPLEARALSAVYCRDRNRKAPLWLGACKTNLGHLGPASGLAGLLKLIGCLRHGEIPANLHVIKPSPYIEWEKLRLALPTTLTKWSAGASLRAGGVSSFGFSGTNVHMVIEEFRDSSAVGNLEARKPLLLPISARDQNSLRILAERFVSYLETSPDSWAAICHTAGAGRDHYSCRIALVAHSKDEAAHLLRDYLNGNVAVSVGEVTTYPKPKLGWWLKNSEALTDANELQSLIAEIARWQMAGFVPEFVTGEGICGWAAAYAAGVLSASEVAALLLGDSLPDRAITLSSHWMHPDGGKALTRSDVNGARFMSGDAVRTLRQAGSNFILEIDGRGFPDADHLARLYTAGFCPNWRALDPSEGARHVALPPTPFRRSRFWAFNSAVSHLPGRRIPLASREHIWGIEISGSAVGYLADHKIGGKVILPGAFIVAWAMKLAGPGSELSSIIFEQPLRLTSSEPWSLQARAHGSEWTVHASSNKDTWIRLATFEVGPKSDVLRPSLSLNTIRHYPHIATRDEYLKLSRDRDVLLGPAFQAIEEIRSSADAAVALLKRPEALAGSEPEADWHPAVLDACLQVCGYLINDRQIWIPAGIDHINVWRPAPGQFWCHANASGMHDSRTFRADLECVDLNGDPLLTIEGAVFRSVEDTDQLRASLPNFADWFYETVWETAGRLTQSRGSRRITIVGGSDGAANLMTRSLEKFGHTVSIPDSIEDSDVVLFLEALNWDSVATDGWDRFKDSIKSLQRVVFGLTSSRRSKFAELWCVGRTANQVQFSDNVSLLQAAWRGACSTLSPEFNDLRVRRIDLGAGLNAHAGDLLAELLSAGDWNEDEWALRGSTWFNPRLRECPERLDFRWKPRTDATYLITGGLGGIGLCVAEDLVGRGARKLVLTARRSPDSEAQRRIAGLRKSGTEVRLVEADVSREDSVRRLIAECQSDSALLRGIFHCAGIVRDGLFLQMKDSDWDTVWSAKVNGGIFLDRFTRETGLDCFVLFSSISAYMGAAGQSNYAAANAALDALAQTRRVSGLPALSINWGAWSQAGMAAAMGQTGERRLASLGLRAMTPQEGCAALSYALGANNSNLTILPLVQWDRLLSKLHSGEAPSRLKTFARIGSQRSQSSLEDSAFEERNDEDRETVLARLQGMAASILGAPGKATDPDRTLLSIGFDSLMAMEMRAQLLKTMGLNIPVSTFLTGVTLRDLAARCIRDRATSREQELFEV